MTFLILAVLLGLIPAAIAQNKGRSFVGWWIYGALLFIIAIIHVLLVSSKGPANQQYLTLGNKKKCPDCAEMIQAEAKVCRFCSHRFAEPISGDWRSGPHLETGRRAS